MKTEKELLNLLFKGLLFGAAIYYPLMGLKYLLFNNSF
jgi:hypothetical protein